MTFTCDSCQAPILFAVVMNNAGRKPKRMPLNPVPDPGGNVAVRADGTGTRIGRVLGKGQEAAGDETLYTPHFATCTHPERPRRNKGRTAVQPSGQRKRPAPTPTLY